MEILGKNERILRVKNPQWFPANLDVYFVFVVLAVIVLRAWLGNASRSFELDETGLLWTIAKGPGQIISRAAHFPQSVAFCFLVSSLAHFFGPSELLLRLPSIIASLVNLGLLYRLARYFLEPRGALATLLVWALNPEVCHMAVAVRPYAIGTSMVLASTWALLRWLDHPSKHRWLGYCALAAAPFYFSYFWALLLLPHAAYALYVYWSRRSVPGLQLILAPAIILLLWFPLLPAFWAAHQTQQLHGIPTPVFLVSFFQSVFPPSYSTGLLAALLLSACISRASIRPQGSGAELLLVSVWAAAPAAALYGAAKLTHLSLFTPKYLLVTAPATALLFSMMLNRHVPLRVFQFGALLIVTVGMFGAIIPWKETLSLRPPKAVEDWRGASRFTSSLLRQEDLPVLATSIFYEGATYPFPVSDSDRDCLLAPLSTYPIGKSPILIPPELHEWNLEYVADVVARMAATKGFLLYTHDNVGALFAQNKGVPWMFYSFAKDFQWQTIYKGGLVEVLRFYRR